MTDWLTGWMNDSLTDWHMSISERRTQRHNLRLTWTLKYYDKYFAISALFSLSLSLSFLWIHAVSLCVYKHSCMPLAMYVCVCVCVLVAGVVAVILFAVCCRCVLLVLPFAGPGPSSDAQFCLNKNHFIANTLWHNSVFDIALFIPCSQLTWLKGVRDLCRKTAAIKLPHRHRS